MKGRFIRLALLVTAALLLPYLAMAVTARRPIAPGEYLIYSGAMVRAAVGHADESGATRAVAYIRAALAEPASTAQLSSSATQVTIPLPPHTTRSPDATGGSNTYITFATDDELVAYLTQTMPQAGWQHVDQMGGGHFFRNGAAEVVISQRYLLSRAIRVLVARVAP
jgi:hypothetical protein